MKISGRISFFIAAVMLFLTLLPISACDPRGELSSEETQKLYDEMKSFVLSGELYKYDASPFLSASISEDEKQHRLEVLKRAAEAAFAVEPEGHIYGSWFSSRSYCKTIYINCQIDVEFNGVVYKMTGLDLSKYSNGAYLMSLMSKPDDKADGIAPFLQLRFEPPK